MSVPNPVRRVVFLFLDGVGIGPDDPDRNPFLRADLPTLRTVLGGSLPTLARLRVSNAGAVAFPLDATLGVDGLPQSGTGQTALLTGRNAPRILGRHFGPWAPVALRPLLLRHNLLARALEAGCSVAFANAYPEGHLDGKRARRLAASPLAAHAAGLVTRHHEELQRGEAVASEITNGGWRRRLGFSGLPRIGPAEAGANLARIASGVDLTFFAHYSTDYAGHRGGMEGAVRALERVDGFLGGLLDALPAGSLLVVASDHGNIEETGGGHTRNPVLGLAVGPVAGEGERSPESITDVAGLVLGAIGVPEGAGSGGEAEDH